MASKSFTLRQLVGAIVGASLLFGFPAFTSASRDELDHTRDQIRMKGRHWLASETGVSRLPLAARKLRLGLFLPQVGGAGSITGPTQDPGISGVAPATLDWRNYNGYSYVTPVRDQESCGSCWAFATTAALEANLLIATGDVSNLAEQVMVSCSGAGSCDGGYIDRASNFIQGTGLPGETAYPYLGTDGACADAIEGWRNATAGITSWHYVSGSTRPTANQIKEELATYGPLVTTMSVYSDFYYYAGGIYQYASGSYQGGHAVLIVGYDDAGEYFIVKNSWGSNWGESGYFKIGYSEFNTSVAFGRYSIAYYTDTTPPGITVRTPNGSESWSAGSTQTIQWSYAGAPGSTVAIALYNDDVFANSIAASAPLGTSGSGSYAWNVPATLAPGSRYRIVVTSNGADASTDASDNYFAITAPVASPLIVTTPNGGESWSRGSSQTIRWSVTGTPGSYVKIELLKGGASVLLITSRTSATAGSYRWRVPSRQTIGSDYAVRVTSISNSTYRDTSDGVFSIR